MPEFSFLGESPENVELRKMISDFQLANQQEARKANVAKQLNAPGFALMSLEAGDGGVTGGFLDDLSADSNSQDARLTALENADSGFGDLMAIAKMGMQIYAGMPPTPGG